MKEEILLKMDSPSRDTLTITGYRFGSGKPTLAIIGAMRGDYITPLHTASKLVKFLQDKFESNPKAFKGEILVVPSLNPFASNMGTQYWPLDKTDIDAMFPGYDKGETTQRIAHAIFQRLQGFDYGIVLEGRKDHSYCMPYVRVLKTGFEDMKLAKRFGLRFVHVRDASPYETGSLLYNWPIFETQTYGVVFGKNGELDIHHSNTVLESIIRFASHLKILNVPTMQHYQSNILTPDRIEVIKAKLSGIFEPLVKPGTFLHKGMLLGTVSDSLKGDVLEEIYAPVDGILTCYYDYPLIFSQAIAFRMAKL